MLAIAPSQVHSHQTLQITSVRKEFKTLIEDAIGIAGGGARSTTPAC